MKFLYESHNWFSRTIHNNWIFPLWFIKKLPSSVCGNGSRYINKFFFGFEVNRNRCNSLDARHLDVANELIFLLTCSSRRRLASINCSTASALAVQRPTWPPTSSRRKSIGFRTMSFHAINTWPRTMLPANDYLFIIIFSFNFFLHFYQERRYGLEPFIDTMLYTSVLKTTFFLLRLPRKIPRKLRKCEIFYFRQLIINCVNSRLHFLLLRIERSLKVGCCLPVKYAGVFFPARFICSFFQGGIL